MTLSPVAFRSFGAGLNLRDKSDAVSEEECIDALNVWFTERGSIRQRDGTAALTGALTNGAESLEAFYRTGAANQLVAGCGTRLEGINTAGAVVASATGLTNAIWDFARFGSPNNEYIYAGNGNDTIRRWDGAAWTAPASMPKGRALAVMAVDQGNRLVTGGFDVTTGGPTGAASTSSPSHVYFSDAGNPESWGANNYIIFTPGDGEKVKAIVAWREMLFVFKETKFFVVYGTTTDVSGNPVFQYYTVDANAGCATFRTAVAGDDGVYFMDRRGVWKTDGSDPQLVSSNIDPIWLSTLAPFYVGGILNHAQIDKCAMAYHQKRVYLTFPSGTSTSADRQAVYDTDYQWWTLYNFPAACMASFRVGDTAELMFGHTSDKKIYRHSNAYTNDAGSAITSRWRSGWFDYSMTDQKTIRESKVWGTGRVYLGISPDFDINYGTLDLLNFVNPAEAATQAAWGASTWGNFNWADPHASVLPAPNPVLRRRALRGTTFSVYFQNNTLDQTWSVHRLVQHLREERIPQVTLQP